MRSLPALVALALVASCTRTFPMPDLRARAGEEVVATTTAGVPLDTIVAVQAGQLVLLSPDGNRFLPLQHVRSVTETRRGLGALQGAGIGLLTGATLGALLGYAEGDDPPCDHCWFQLSAGDKALLSGMLAGGLGGVLGLVIGASLGARDVYEHRADSRPAPRYIPSGPPGSVGGMTIRF